VVVVGAVGMNLQRQYMYEKELDFVISTSYGPGRYDKLYEEKGVDYPYAYVRWTENRNMEEFLNMISEKKVNVERLMSLEFSVDEAPRAYEAITGHEPKPLGVVIRYPNFQSPCQTSELQRKVFINNDTKRQKSKDDVVNIAVIGAGNFSESVHLPNLKKIKGYNLKAIVCQHAERAKVLGKRFGAEYATTDYKEVLADDDIDAVLIATRHNLHAPMTIEAAKAGKNVFVEKPMVLNREEVEQIQEVISQTGIKYTVGFNRRYSSLVLRVRDLLGKIKRPYLITYRVNAGFIPKSSWVHDPAEGGGRIIGECCHFFDLFNYIVDSEIEDVVVRSIPTNGVNVVADDNFASIVSYIDGSLAVLIYASTGSTTLPKERIEIFADGTSIVIDDFKKIEYFGKEHKHVVLKKKDKGHNDELTEFLNLVRGQPSKCLTFQEAAIATEITFKIVDMIGRKQIWEQEGKKG
jgi:predicted dehydrogenase